jgi:hypothetical protein
MVKSSGGSAGNGPSLSHWPTAQRSGPPIHYSRYV